jgi:carbamoyltransferase
MGTELDALAIGNLYLKKTAQNSALKLDYKNAFELD